VFPLCIHGFGMLGAVPDMPTTLLTMAVLVPTHTFSGETTFKVSQRRECGGNRVESLVSPSLPREVHGVRMRNQVISCASVSRLSTTVWPSRPLLAIRMR
jgi:hypothetical protein